MPISPPRRGCSRALLPESGTAVVNADSDRAAQLAEICARRGIRFWTYGAKGRDFRLLRDEPTPPGQHLVVEVAGHAHEVELPLVGGFQASNALAALGLVVATGGDVGARRGGAGDAERRAGPAAARGAPQDRRAGLCRLCPQARGAGDGARDLRPFAKGKLVVVFGCGGDRDRGKRPVMGEIATRLADLTLVTDDNPRSEEPAAIRAEIVRGIPAGRRNWIEVRYGPPCRDRAGHGGADRRPTTCC